MYTISPLYQIINFNVSTWYLKPLNIKWDQRTFRRFRNSIFILNGKLAKHS